MPAVAGMDKGDMALQELLAVDAAFTMPMPMLEQLESGGVGRALPLDTMGVEGAHVVTTALAGEFNHSAAFEEYERLPSPGGIEELEDKTGVPVPPY